jgi:hypothetical protein
MNFNIAAASGASACEMLTISEIWFSRGMKINSLATPACRNATIKLPRLGRQGEIIPLAIGHQEGGAPALI